MWHVQFYLDEPVPFLYNNKETDGDQTTTLKGRRNVIYWLMVFVVICLLGSVTLILYSSNFMEKEAHSILNDEIINGTIVTTLPPKEIVYHDITLPSPTNENHFNGIKLPTNVLPISYLLYIYPRIRMKKYTGFISIRIMCKKVTSQIILHSIHHTIYSINIKSEKDKVTINKHYRQKSNEMLVVLLNQNLAIGIIYELRIHFGNILTDGVSTGLYLTDFKDRNGEKHQMVATNFEPIDARKAWPCFDEPEMKATWEIIVKHPVSGFHAISNMPVKKKVYVGSNSIETHFKTTPKMSSYLVALAVTEYVYKSVKSDAGVKIDVYAPPGRLSETSLAVIVASVAVDFYAEKFGMKYALPKLDLMPLTDFSSEAEENWGLMTFIENKLLHNFVTGSLDKMEDTALLISHEISHQWFGDLVTMKWWNDRWLKEAFASYFANLPLRLYYPYWELESLFYINTIDYALQYDSSKLTRPIAVGGKEGNPELILDSYDAITYSKGAAVITMLAEFLGKDAMFKGINLYLNKYKYSNADTNQLWKEFSKVVPSVDVLAFMKPWVTQSGFPLISVKRVGNKLIINQERFMYLKKGKKQGKHSSLLWHVPIYVKLCGKLSMYSFKAKSAIIEISPTCGANEWYKVNYGSGGFYRVSYDNKNWLNLLKLMNVNHSVLPAIDRANLLADVDALVRFQHEKISRLLDFTNYLDKELHYVPWKVASAILDELRDVFYDTKLKNCFERYTSKKIAPVIETLSNIKHHTHIQKKLTLLMFTYASKYNTKPLVDNLKIQYFKWLDSKGKYVLPVHLRQIIMSEGILNGNIGGWNMIFIIYKRAKSVEEQKSMLRILALTSNKKLLQRLVKYSYQNLKISVLTQVCNNRKGKDIAWKATKVLWKSLLERYSSTPDRLANLLRSCLGSGSTSADLSEVKAFITSFELGVTKVVFERIIERIEQNIELKKQERTVTSWFQKKDPGCLT